MRVYRIIGRLVSHFAIVMKKLFSNVICYFFSSISDGKMSLVLRKLAFCICKNKDADQLRSNRKADQRLCFRYSDSMIPLLF